MTGPKEITLLPCPFCGGTDILSEANHNRDYAQAKCNDCLAYGPFVDQVGGYWKPAVAWNIRPGQWQPIELARTDGVGVLVWWPLWWHEPFAAYFRNNQWHSDKADSWTVGDDNGPMCFMPMPLIPLINQAKEAP